MKTYLSCSLAGLALLTASSVHAGGMEGYGVPSNMAFYGGASAGMSQYDGACAASSTSNECEDSSSGYKVFAGVRLSPNQHSRVMGPGGISVPTASLPTLGAEIGYIDFGESTADDHVGRPAPGGFNADVSSEVSAVYAAGVGYLPVAQGTELIGKAGVAYWDQKGKLDVPTEPTLNNESSNSGVGLMLGAGAQYHINPNLSIRGEYEHIMGTGSDTSYESDASMLSLGAVFSTL